MDEINYSTPDQQIDKLKSQNLIINDIDYAKEQLRLYGYSSLIKSYREPYMVTNNGKKEYRAGVTFEQVRSLYILDKNLRNAVMGAMLDLEEHVKECAANVIANSFGTHQDDYLKFKNYRDKRKSIKRFTLSSILTTMTKTLNTDKNPIAHYAQEHGIVPPWILFKSIYFSTIINFIHLFKPEQQHAVALSLYDNSELKISDEALSQLMMDSLYICLEYRNKSAHGGRIYSHSSNRTVEFFENFPSSFNGFSQLLLVLKLFKYQAPYTLLDNALTRELSRHCSRFPEDVTYLAKILDVNITTEEPVWISKTSKKYHTNPNCGGLRSATSIELTKAESQGYKPCKKCFR